MSSNRLSSREAVLAKIAFEGSIVDAIVFGHVAEDQMPEGDDELYLLWKNAREVSEAFTALENKIMDLLGPQEASQGSMPGLPIVLEPVEQNFTVMLRTISAVLGSPFQTAYRVPHDNQLYWKATWSISDPSIVEAGFELRTMVTGRIKVSSWTGSSEATSTVCDIAQVRETLLEILPDQVVRILTKNER